MGGLSCSNESSISALNLDDTVKDFPLQNNEDFSLPRRVIGAAVLSEFIQHLSFVWRRAPPIARGAAPSQGSVAVLLDDVESWASDAFTEAGSILIEACESIASLCQAPVNQCAGGCNGFSL